MEEIKKKKVTTPRDKAKKIIDGGKANINSLLFKQNNFMENKTAAMQMTLCFYPDYNIRFIPGEATGQFGPSDIWFNGDITVRLGGNITMETINWDLLENILAEDLRRRKLLKDKVAGKMMQVPFNVTVRSFLMENFVDNVITAAAELEEFGNTHTGALYKEFLDEGSELRTDFFTELGKMYKRKIYADI